jgi:hypothetical protein
MVATKQKSQVFANQARLAFVDLGFSLAFEYTDGMQNS